MTFLPDGSLLTGIRPAPGHPLANGSVSLPEPEPTETVVAAIWTNLHDLAQEWGTFASTLPALESSITAQAFQALGMAFLALSHEESAYAHYLLVANRLRYPACMVAEGLEQTGVDWTAVGLWLERLANDAHMTPALLEQMRPMVMQARAQQHRLWSLLLQVQQEYAQLTTPAQQEEQP
jgi:hypothetical protein